MSDLRFVTIAKAPAVAVGRPPQVALPGNRWDLLNGVIPAELPFVSVIVPYYEQQAELDRTLVALARQTYPADRLEIIVVDDGSLESPRVPPGVRVLTQLDRGFRVAAARNLGAEHARGELLCFLDADSSPEPSYIRELTRLPALSPDVVTVGSRRHADFSGVDASVAIEQAGPAHALPSPRWLDEEYARSADLLTVDDRSYRFMIGAVTCCRHSFFDVVGGFDETFTDYGGEDWQWAHRAFLNGAVFAHVPTAVAWHDGPDWAARVPSLAARVARKNVETVRLAESITSSAARPAALRTGMPAIVVRMHAATSLAALIVCVDEVLSALPQAVVIAPNAVDCGFEHASERLGEAFRFDDRVLLREPHADLLASAAVTIDIPAAARGLSEALRLAASSVIALDFGIIELTAASDRVLARLSSSRATRREDRWNVTLFDRATSAVAGAERITEEPDLEARFGGWG